jgi:hypothetical protein
VLVELLVVLLVLVDELVELLVELLVDVLVVVGMGHVQSRLHGRLKAPQGLPGGSQSSNAPTTLSPQVHWQFALQRNAPLVLVHGNPGGSQPSPGSRMPLPHGGTWATAGIRRATVTMATAIAAMTTRAYTATLPAVFLACVLDIAHPSLFLLASTYREQDRRQPNP